ncbi:hypothetical protein OPT61_g8071 [Boeremia exigua]|uniref:Uncharacterized protein n=1 Tax=Boeremia exigua TaxID=749465 RepID=A0ACC2I0T0_9PLEO|nr:hypothetical protein OPT61_g8071 [Boeremia exigua]
MATYMYTSATGSNWDDDDDDFDVEVYEAAATEFSVSTPLDNNHHREQYEAVIESEDEMKQLSPPVSSESAIDYDISRDLWPNYAQKMTESRLSNESRPAYIELSQENGIVYPEQRTNYKANWMATKLYMGANMRFPMMMKPSPLRLSMTWAQDSGGEFIREGGCLFLPCPSPPLLSESNSEEDHNERKTPIESRSMQKVTQCKEELEEVSILLITLGVSSTNLRKTDKVTEASDVDQSHAFPTVNLMDEPQTAKSMAIHPNSIVRDLDHAVSSSDVTEVKEPLNLAFNTQVQTLEMLSLTMHHAKMHSNVHLTTTTVGITQTNAICPQISAWNHSGGCSDSECHVDNTQPTLTGYTPPPKITSSSPDFEYIQKPTKISTVSNTVASGLFTLSLIPWGHIAVTMAGALVEMVTSVINN